MKFSKDELQSTKSISISAQHVICTVKLDEEKSKCAGLAHENGFWLSIIVQYIVTGKRHSNAVHLQKTV